MTFLRPAGFALLGLAIPVILLHILRPRRLPVTVSSIFLLRKIEAPVSASAPWQRLRWSLLLLAQLLAVALLALAVAQPVRLEASPLAQHTVFIIDASGSMDATDGSPDRLADAKDRAVELRESVPDGGTASIVVAAGRPRVVLTDSADEDEFAASLRTVDPVAGHPDFAAAFSLAKSLDAGRTSVGYVFISDGGITAEEEQMLPPGTRYERIGSSDTNRTITHLTVEPRGTGLHARVGVRNTGGPAATQEVRVDVDGVTASSKQVTLEPGGQAEVEFDVPAGVRIEAFLEGGDLLSADDHAVAVAPARPDLRVLLVGDELFWKQLLEAIPGVTVDVVDAVRPAGAATSEYDVAIYSGVDPPTEPTAPYLAVAPPNGVPGVTVLGTVDLPAIALVRADDVLLDDIDLSEVDIASAQRVDPGAAEVLVGAEDAPLLLRGTADGRRFVYLTFVLRDSDLPVQVAFPLLGERLLTELLGVEQISTSLEVGSVLPVDPGVTKLVAGPDGRQRTVQPGDGAPRADRPGFWTISVADRPDVLIAVNPPIAESELTPADALTAPAPTSDRVVAGGQRQTSLLDYVLYALLALLVLETVLAWRNLGVGARQWGVALAVRAVVAGLVVAALLGPVIERRAGRVATVFVVDQSGSMSPAARAEAEQFLRDSLAARGDDDLVGVVAFGADAQIDRVMQASSEFSATAAVVDPSATDLAGALRLGAAMLPSDARRRVVLISDGRANAGDTADGIAEMSELGVPVDVHTVAASAGLDAALEGIDVPRVARVDEVVPITVHVSSGRETPATVTLRREGVDIGSQDINLVVGDNIVTFSDTTGPEPGGLLRYQAVVTVGGDTLAENDTAFAAVPVEGPARVLVVEGTTGEATTLVSALTAASIGSDVVGVADVPSVAQLATYAGIVLVDVDARSLTGPQIEALTTAVRDLGRGLVTIGGVRSYGVGGYRQSPLSDLLPVDSEIVDPTRRKTVAEVLSIDTSGSMAACHCREGSTQMNAGGMMEGGVNKTDISRAAAERTIGALAATDEIGVLAWNTGSKWIIDLQQLPAADVVENGLRQLQPDGSTNLGDSLREASNALLASSAELKHIILFTDGFTDPAIIENVADEAGRLYEESGITTSVMGTGEGAAPALEDIAIQGHGRYQPGTDLDNVPQLMAEEAVIASRDFITEGDFLPEVTSDDPVVASLTSSPPLLGYVATSAKSQSSTLLRIGPDRDPLLATWQVGLGRATSWTSDVTNWSANWEQWDGFVDFWAGVVKDTFPTGDDVGAAQADVGGGHLNVDVQGAKAFPDGATAVAHVAGPDGQSIELPLERTADDAFSASTDATRTGTYAVGVTVSAPDGKVVLAANTLANESYPVEFVPGAADPATLARISAATDGRGEILPADAFDADGLQAGVRRADLTLLLLLIAAALWPIAVLLSRLSWRGASVRGAAGAMSRAGRRVVAAVPRLSSPDPDNAPVRDVAKARRPKPMAADDDPSDVPVVPQPAVPRVTPRVDVRADVADAGSAPDDGQPAATPRRGQPSRAATVNELLAQRRRRQAGDDDP